MNRAARLNNRISIWRRAASLMLAVAVLACSGIFSAPMGADTVWKLICENEEHVHTDECFEGVLICGVDADVEGEEHVHSDECYGFGLICALEEHTHSDECYIEVELGATDETPDETPSDDNFNGETFDDDNNVTDDGDSFENDIPSEDDGIDEYPSDDGFAAEPVFDYTAYLPVERTGDVREDTFNIANFQVGVTEGQDGYTPYVAWLNEPYGAWDSVAYDEWNTAFAYFCLYHAGVESFMFVQYGVDIKSWVVNESGLFTTLNDGSPVRGDLVYLNNGRIGIFFDMYVDEFGNEWITLIEGDVDYYDGLGRRVAVCTYSAFDVAGFATFGEMAEQDDGNMETLADDGGTLVVFDSPDGSAWSNDFLSEKPAVSYAYFNVAGTTWQGLAPCCNIDINTLRSLFTTGGYTFSFIYGGTPAGFNGGTPRAVINNNYNDYCIDFEYAPVDGGKYKATVSLDVLFEKLKNNGLTSNDIATFSVQISTDNFILYHAEFTKSSETRCPEGEVELAVNGYNYPYSDAPGTANGLFFDIEPVSVGETVKVHFRGESESDFRIWISNSDSPGADRRASKPVFASELGFTNGEFDFVIEITTSDDENLGVTRGTHIQFKGASYNKGLTNFELLHLGIVYPEKTYPQNKIHVKLSDEEILDKDEATKAQKENNEPNSLTNPYIVYVGEMLELITYYTPPSDSNQDNSGYWGDIIKYFDFIKQDGSSSQYDTSYRSNNSVSIKLEARTAGEPFPINVNIKNVGEPADRFYVQVKAPYEINKIYYRIKDIFDKYRHGTADTYEEFVESGKIDALVGDTIELQALVDSAGIDFVLLDQQAFELVSYEKVESDGQWLLTAVYKVLNCVGDGTAGSVPASVCLSGIAADGATVDEMADFIVKGIEKHKIYYRPEGVGEFVLNETSSDSPFRVLDGDVIEVFAEIVDPVLDIDGNPDLGNRLGFFVDTGELSLHSTLIYKKIDDATNRWRISASLTADTASKAAKIDLRVNFDPSDTLYVEIDYKPNTIYYRLNDFGAYKQNYGNIVSAYISRDKNDTIDLIALIALPSGVTPDANHTYFYAADPSYIDVSALPFEPVNDDGVVAHWYVKAKATVKRVTPLNVTTPIILCIDDINVDNALNVNIKDGTKIHVHNITLGTMDYDYVDRNTATSMLTGVFTENSAENRYIVFVGETLDLSATTSGEFTGYSGLFERLAFNDDEITGNDAMGQIVESKIRLLAKKTGTCAITLNPSNPQESETIYISVRYPIYVKNSSGRMHKNKINEFLELLDSWKRGSPDVISDTNFNPIYKKNLAGNRYWLFEGDSTQLTSYVPIDFLTCNNSSHTHTDSCFSSNTPKFSSNNGIARVENSFKVVTIDGVDFIEVTADVKINDNIWTDEQSVNITLGNSNDPLDIFYVLCRTKGYGTQHFDIEIADGGSYTTLESVLEVDKDGNPVKRIITERIFATIVSAVDGCTIYGVNGSFTGYIPAGEYWKHGIEGEDTQFEITSAYLTDGNGNMVPGPDGKEQVFWGRSYPRRDIELVEFELTLDINLKSIRRYAQIYENGKWVLVEDPNSPDYPEQPEFSEYKETITNYKAKMDYQQILDAYNKCPNHFGADFTLMINHVYPIVSLEFSKILVGGVLEENQFTFDLYRDTRDPDDIKQEADDIIKPDIVNDLGIAHVDVAKNNKYGIIKFNPQEYQYVGEYIYYITERLNEADSGIVYDGSLMKIVVNVERLNDDDDNGIYAETLTIASSTAYYWEEPDPAVPDSGGWKSFGNNKPAFINYVKYILPATGGEGTKQYIYFGGAITLIGFILLCKSKRREVSP